MRPNVIGEMIVERLLSPLMRCMNAWQQHRMPDLGVLLPLVVAVQGPAGTTCRHPTIAKMGTVTSSFPCFQRDDLGDPTLFNTTSSPRKRDCASISLACVIPRRLQALATMDPVSTIASAIAMSQLLALGVKGLRSLRHTSDEFHDMLDELSNLQGWLGQLGALMESIASDPNHSTAISPDAVNQLETVKIELDLIVSEMNEITARLLSRGPRPLSKTAKVSLIDWQFKLRGKVSNLKDRAKKCRESLTTCLALFGLAQR